MFDTLWAFLLDENNRNVLAWLGAGVVVVAGGVWTVVKFRAENARKSADEKKSAEEKKAAEDRRAAEKAASPPPKTHEVHAEHGGVAFGGSNFGSPINIGLPPPEGEHKGGPRRG